MKTNRPILNFAFCALALYLLLTLTVLGADKARTFTITIKRSAGTEGKLSCVEAKLTDVPCFWKASKRIPAGTYSGGSTTIMETKGYQAVEIPNVLGFNGIFIHQGSGPGFSDGCIVTPKENIVALWDAIPKDQHNITIIVTDE